MSKPIRTTRKARKSARLTPAGKTGKGATQGRTKADISAWEALKPIEQRFVCEYIKSSLNATRAAMKAGYSQNQGTAATTAWRLLKRAEIRAAISQKNAEHGVTPDFLISEALARLQIRVADFSEFLEGKASLEDLEARGVNVDAVEKAVVYAGGAGRAVEATSPASLLEFLRKLIGAGEDTLNIRGVGSPQEAASHDKLIGLCGDIVTGCAHRGGGERGIPSKSLPAGPVEQGPPAGVDESV